LFGTAGLGRVGVVSAWPAQLIVRPLTPDDAACIAGWRYPGRWQTYDLDQGEDLLSPAAGYFAVAGAGGPAGARAS
jgi:hypothetical protein